MFDKDKKAARVEAGTSRLEDHAARYVPQALTNLRERRAWLVTKLAQEGRGKITGTMFDDDVEKLARQLHYIDSAIASLSADVPNA
jgi:hypothetical protein